MSAINEFRDWMDARGLKSDDVASKFDVSPQTISHWRSQGVPERRQSLVRYIMSTWTQAPEAAGSGVRQQIVVRPTPEQFDRWNDAALAEGKRISDWALEGLDRLAAEWDKGLRVVEETAEEREERWRLQNTGKVADEAN